MVTRKGATSWQVLTLIRPPSIAAKEFSGAVCSVALRGRRCQSYADLFSKPAWVVGGLLIGVWLAYALSRLCRVVSDDAHQHPISMFVAADLREIGIGVAVPAASAVPLWSSPFGPEALLEAMVLLVAQEVDMGELLPR